jgi:Ca2+/Na+ antiporter
MILMLGEIFMTKFLIKTAITIGLTFGSMIATIMGYLFLGCLVGRILHPSTHEHEYACACDEPPTMTESEATIVGIIFMIGLMIGLFFILRQLKFSKWERLIALIILLFANLYVASIFREILYIQVTG